MTRRAATAAITAVVLVLAVPAMAFAAGDDVGANLGKMLTGWGAALYWGIGAIVAISLFLGRKYADLMVFGVFALVIGGFIFSHGTVQNVITSMWRALAG